MVTLRGCAGIVVGGLRRRLCVDVRGLVVGVAHPRGGPLAQHRIQARAQFGGQPAGDRRHAIEVLASDGDAAAARPILVGEVPVRVDAVGQPLGEHAQLVGTQHGGLLGEISLGALAGGRVHPARQLGEEAADLGHVFGVDVPGALRCRGRRPQRLQRFTGQCGASGQHLGVGDAAACFTGADAQPVGQVFRQRFADLLRGGLQLDVAQGFVLDRRRLAAAGLHRVEHREQIGHVQPVQRQSHQIGQRRPVPIDGGQHRVAGQHLSRTHMRRLSPCDDTIAALSTSGTGCGQTAFGPAICRTLVLSVASRAQLSAGITARSNSSTPERSYAASGK